LDPPSLLNDQYVLAAIEAAKITAAATTRAARIQAVTGLAAIAAGALAYFGAVRQVRLQERMHEVRAIAYRFRIGKVVEEYLDQITEAAAIAKRQLTAFQTNGQSVSITSFRVARPAPLNDENWEMHALLGRRAVELILAIEDASGKLAAFDQEIRLDATRTGGNFAAGTLRLVEENRDGAPAFGPEQAIIDYVQVLDRLRATLVALRRELAERPHTRLWRLLHASARRVRKQRPVGRSPARVGKESPDGPPD
jgi:hypothetical protein